jgi:hypothetical protein
VGETPGDGDARLQARVRRAVVMCAVVVCAVVAVAVLPGCTLRGQVRTDHDPQPTGTQVDPMERPVARSGSNMPGTRSGPSTTTTTTEVFN